MIHGILSILIHTAVQQTASHVVKVASDSWQSSCFSYLKSGITGTESPCCDKHFLLLFHYVAKDDPELRVLQPPPPEC